MMMKMHCLLRGQSFVDPVLPNASIVSASILLLSRLPEKSLVTNQKGREVKLKKGLLDAHLRTGFL
ncbi:hypothetical protein C5167_027425 [Papaver somniferum]|nr:hypothetical protein C5167_027425 [Papaver somniferum]